METGNPPDDIVKFLATSFFEAKFNIKKGTQYGQTEIVSGFRNNCDSIELDVDLLLECSSVRQ